MDEFYDFLIQPSDKCINSKDAIDLILDFNEKHNYIWFEHSSAECNFIELSLNGIPVKI